MNDERDPDNQIPLMPLGELRMMGMKIPDHLKAAPDDQLLCLPPDLALTWLGRILTQWAVSEPEATAFLDGISHDDMGDVIAIHQLLRVLFTVTPPEEIVQAANAAFDGQSLWQVVRDGDAQRVRAHLAHRVFGGGW